MKSFTFKRTETTNMKIAGVIDTDTMIIDVDEEEKNLSTLLSVFNGANVEINVKLKTEEELEEPTSEDRE